ncbi:MAG: DUF1214 domain-containing protein [Nevskiaceae bacterium]|nr:MAG: DUF1214 domain-containing protein [Nevskiaceae bacterium]
MTARDEVLSGQAWDDFCDALKRAGRQVLRPEAAADEVDRAEGWRYLTRLLRIGLEMHLEFADPEFPGFFLPSHETGKIGADNPDNLYAFARISGAHDYVIRGTRGSVSYLSIGTQKGGYETDGTLTPTGFIDGQDLHLDAEGRFEVLLSQREPAAQEGKKKNWLRIESASNAVIVRQTFLDRAVERPAQLRIERLQRDASPAPLNAERLHKGLANAARFVDGTATLFANWAQGFLPHVNALPPQDQAPFRAAGGDPNIFYYHSAWQLADDEALVVHVPRIPECRFWNLQINNWWMESLDYRFHRICHNQHSARRDADGGVTLVIAHRDPGHANWLETAGHHRGTMCFRWVGAKEHVHPQTRVVKFADLSKETTR